MSDAKVHIIECPRDAMQGIHQQIPTELKARYINALLQVGFDTIDFGSFVSPKAIPQMADTAELLSMLDLSATQTKLLAIVANQRGAADACLHEPIQYLGYPFSISETFQMRNTNATIDQSMDRVEEIQDLCLSYDKQLVVYLSMGFGNPYGDPWSAEVCAEWAGKLYDMGIRTMALSDTIGVANPQSIKYLFSRLIPLYPDVAFGAHFHTTPDSWREKVDAAFKAGCRRFDGALKGYGGCPMAKDDLTGNMPTENLLAYLDDEDVNINLSYNSLIDAFSIANEVFAYK